MTDDTLEPGASGGLINRNVTVNGRRTSLRLEPEMWDAIEEIAKRENVRVSDVVSRIDREVRSGAFQGSGLTARVRVFVLGYFRAAATERGHMNAGHGLFYGGEGRRG
jgi:predicted DNA-binding ribbon-helix-helix protein